MVEHKDPYIKLSRTIILRPENAFGCYLKCTNIINYWIKSSKTVFNYFRGGGNHLFVDFRAFSQQGGALSLCSDPSLSGSFNLKVRGKKQFKVTSRNQWTVALIKPPSYRLVSLHHFGIDGRVHCTASTCERTQNIGFHFGWNWGTSPTFWVASICHLLDRTAQLIRPTTPTSMNCPLLLLNPQIHTVIIWMKPNWGQVKVVRDKPVRYD